MRHERNPGASFADARSSPGHPTLILSVDKALAAGVGVDTGTLRFRENAVACGLPLNDPREIANTGVVSAELLNDAT